MNFKLAAPNSGPRPAAETTATRCSTACMPQRSGFHTSAATSACKGSWLKLPALAPVELVVPTAAAAEQLQVHQFRLAKPTRALM